MPRQLPALAQRLAADDLVTLYQLDTTSLGGTVYYFTPGTVTGPIAPQIITNPCAYSSFTGWTTGGSQAPTNAGPARTAAPNWTLDDLGTGFIYRPSLSTNAYCDIYWRPGGGNVPVTPGVTYEFQALLQAHRCTGDVRIAFYTSAIGYITEFASPGTQRNSSTGTIESSYDRRVIRAVAPANAAFAVPIIRMTAATGIDPFVFFTKALMGAVPADSVSPIPWVPFVANGSPVFQSQVYTPVPIEAEGFEWSGRGPIPRPRIRISNINNLAGALAINMADLLGCKLTRIRTFARHLDGGSQADSGQIFEPDIWFLDRKVHHSPAMIEWEMASIMDVEGRQLPGRQILRDVCTHTYRRWNSVLATFDYSAATCPYTGSRYIKASGADTGIPSEDSCGRRLVDCKARFGTAPLPTRAFPGVGKTPNG